MLFSYHKGVTQCSLQLRSGIRILWRRSVLLITYRLSTGCLIAWGCGRHPVSACVDEFFTPKVITVSEATSTVGY